ncbi:unnamed protein product [Nezara viridula]|uniref:Uncharacterized protein n=1 Tax=Nezara viridula TaxID=85310 RepID=A0A9P0EAG9_NEZVI|nr:unnamed protein product [Nezara viridula]
MERERRVNNNGPIKEVNTQLSILLLPSPHPHAIMLTAFRDQSRASRADHEETKRGRETNKKINQQLQKDKQVYRATHRLLLLVNNLAPAW